jgi:3-hydroxyacyl-CoA dehydrogenase
MSRSDPVTLAFDGDIALLRIDNPPVNAISPDVVQGLERAIECFEQDRSAQALVIACAGRTFVAGGDIAAFDEPSFSAAPFNRVLARVEASARPVVAALHGTVLGGGLELALACHWRLATAEAQFGFPEVKLGLLPGSLGTQRLPRLIGAEPALDMIASGRSIGALQAQRLDLVDRIAAGDLQAQALLYARELVSQGLGPRRASERSVDAAAIPDRFFESALERAATDGRAYPALRAIAHAIEASLLPFSQGEAVEARLFKELLASRQSKALRHLFFAQRQAAKIPGLSKDTRRRPVSSVGVLGAGTMGRGIAMNFLNAGLPVTLVDTTAEATQAACHAIRGLYEASAAKGKLSAPQVEQRMALLHSGDDAALADADLVIEAVYESMDLKLQVCARLGRICKPDAIIATNTSTLDVDRLAVATGRPGDIVGMHFFSPAHVMKLLEVVRGAHTAPDVLATVMDLARTIGKVAVVSGVCYGFIGNRMAEVYMREAEFLIMEGATPAEVDGAIEGIGMAMGPCRMLDMAGIDVGAKTVIEYRRAGGLPPDDSYRALVLKLFEVGRHGQKTRSGYYRYEGRTPVPDPETVRIAEELARAHGIARRQDIGGQEIVERLLYPMFNEAAKILEEGIAYRASDIDVVWTSGYGFPDHQGGPLFMADQIGWPVIADRLAHYARVRGDSFGYWKPAALVEDLTRDGRRISDWNGTGEKQ